MHLSRAGYYADFVVYPFLVMVLSAIALGRTAPHAWVEWFGAFVLGVAIWTLSEYVFHRFLLHDVPYFARMHNEHHAEPTGFVGTPTWLSFAVIIGGILLPLWWSTNFDFASGLTTGFSGGYLWYVSIHHAVHHWRIKEGTYLFHAKRRHALHHFARQSCNFGVTSGFWDRVFGTVFETRRADESVLSP
jgi:sterol desaturase/sphingolipid hydroxylase (fatty acid hydroxylase superfamily)